MVLSLQAEQPVKPTHNDSWSCSKLHAAQPWSTWKRERQRVGAMDDTSAGSEWKMGGPISWSPRGGLVSETLLFKPSWQQHMKVKPVVSMSSDF